MPGSSGIRNQPGSPWPARRPLVLLVLMFVTVGLVGCGYTLRPPYDPEIQTVYVPVFRSFSFRDDLNLMLTEEVIKEINQRTPYRVVNSPEEADTILSGTILFAKKNEQLINRFNLPRQMNAELVAEVTWEDNRPGGDPNQEPPTTRITENLAFYPELGETTSLAYSKTIRKMAKDIVNMMEEPW